MRGCARRRRSCSGSAASATWTGGRSRVATSTSCAAAPPTRWSRSSATTTRTSARWPTWWGTWSGATPIRRLAAPPRAATSPASRERSLASVDSTRHSNASTPPFRPRTNDRSPRYPRGRSPSRSWRARRRPNGGSPPPAGLRRTAETAGATAGIRHGGSLRRALVEERLHLDRAHVLRRLGRIEDADAAWAALAASPGRIGVVAAIELSKLREHRLRDPVGAFEAATRGLAAAERRRRIGRPEPVLEANLVRRLERLRKRLEGRRASGIS